MGLFEGGSERSGPHKRSGLVGGALVAVLVLLALVPGSAIAAGAAGGRGDFNGDGYSDLAIGAPGEDTQAGAVSVYYGGPNGLSNPGAQFWQQGSDGLYNPAEPGDGFGAALAAADFDGDGFADLAVGAPGEDGGFGLLGNGKGAVSIIYGSQSGLQAQGNQFFQQGADGLKERAESGDNFGKSLAAVRIGSGARSGLAIGAPGEDLGRPKIVNAGAVSFLFPRPAAARNPAGTGTRPNGLVTQGNQLWTENSQGIRGANVRNAFFGASLASGDLGRSSSVDLAIGAYGERLGPVRGSGAVHVLYGGSSGLAAQGNQLWTQDTGTIRNRAEKNDYFGFSLAIGRLDNDAALDLAVGAPYEKLGSADRAGAVNVIYGHSNGLVAQGNQLFTQNTKGVPGVGAEERDYFGASLASADFGRGQFGDLAVGAPGETLPRAGKPNQQSAGEVDVLYSTPAGRLSGNRAQRLARGIGDLPGGPNLLDNFGWALGARNFGDPSQFDLAIGVPGAKGDEGGVSVIYGHPSGLDVQDVANRNQSDGGLSPNEDGDQFGYALAPPLSRDASGVPIP